MVFGTNFHFWDFLFLSKPKARQNRPAGDFWLVYPIIELMSSVLGAISRLADVLRRCRRHRQSRDVLQKCNSWVRMLPGD